MKQIKVNVDFTKHTISRTDEAIVSGDYNVIELKFNFDNDYFAQGKRIFFEMKNPKGEVVMVKELESDTLALVGFDKGGKEYSLFAIAGRYIFELSLYSADSKETSASENLIIDQEQVVIGDEIIYHYYPAFDQVIKDSAKALENSETALKKATDVEDRANSGEFNGEDGSTFTPSVSDEGIISWTNDGGLPNPEPKDIQGKDGKSAYQIAVDNGFVGTEQEWLDSLKAQGIIVAKVKLVRPFPPITPSYYTTEPKPSELLDEIGDGKIVYLIGTLDSEHYNLTEAQFTRATFSRVRKVSDSEIRIDEFEIERETEKAIESHTTYKIPKIDDNTTSLESSWSSQKITDELNRPQHNILRITATKNPLGSGYISDYSSSEIKNWIDAGGDAELYFNDTIEGSGEQIYHYIKFQNRTAYFRRNVLTEGEVRQIDIAIYGRNITFTDLKQKFATPDDIQMLEDSKANYVHKVIASDKVSQLDATEVLTYIDQYDGKLIEFLTNGENPSKAVATGRVFTTTQGDAYLITYNLDGTTTVWNKENYEKHQIETSSLINAGLIDVDNLTVDIQGDAPHLYSVRDAMNTPNSIKGDGCVFVLPHSLNKQIQYYIDMTSGNQWYRLVTGTDSKHSFGVWQEMGGSSSGEVWEDVIPKYTIGTASNQILVPVETTKHYKKLQIIYRNNLTKLRHDSYTYYSYMVALTSTTHTSEPLGLAAFDASMDNTNNQSLMHDDGYLVSQIELVSDDIYITKSFTKLNTVADIANPQTHSESMFDDDGLLTGFILFTPADAFTDGFVAGGTIEIKGVAI